MNADHRGIKVKRVASRKRSRDASRSHLTPAKKRTGSPEEPEGGHAVLMMEEKLKGVSMMALDGPVRDLHGINYNMFLFC